MASPRPLKRLRDASTDTSGLQDTANHAAEAVSVPTSRRSRPKTQNSSRCAAFPMTSVTVVCRLNAAVSAIGDVVWLVDAFVSVAGRWTVAEACDKPLPGALRLLPRIAALEDPGIDPILKRRAFTQALENAVKRGDLSVVKWLVDEYLPEGRVRHPLVTAAHFGQLHVLQWLYHNHGGRIVWSRDEILAAADGDKFETVQWLHDYISPVNIDDKRYLMEVAMKEGNADLAEFLVGLDGMFVEPDTVAAARRGHLSVIKWVNYRLGVKLTKQHMDAAVTGGHRKLAKWLRLCASIHDVAGGALLQAAKQSNDLDIVVWALNKLQVEFIFIVCRVIDTAAAKGRLDVIKLIHEKCRGTCTVDAMDSAAEAGHLEIVEFLHENREEGCTTRAMDRAAGNGHLDVVKWLQKHRPEGCTTEAMDSAASGNHLEVVRWLHENRSEGCTTEAMDSAACGGHLDVVIWLHENRKEGCTSQAMDEAACNGHMEVVQWLHRNRSEGCTPPGMDDVAAIGSLEMLQWLHSNRSEGCTTHAMDHAAAHGLLDVVTWLHSNRSEGCTTDAIDIAAELGHLKVVQFLVENRREGFTVDAITIAASYGHLDIVQYLLKHLKGTTFGSRTMHSALDWGNLEVAIALQADGRFAVDPRSIDAAARTDDMEVVQWLAREYPDSISFLPKLPGGVYDPYVEDCLQELEKIKTGARTV